MSHRPEFWVLFYRREAEAQRKYRTLYVVAATWAGVLRVMGFYLGAEVWRM